MMKDLRNPSFAALAAREGGQCYFCGSTRNRTRAVRFGAEHSATKLWTPRASAADARATPLRRLALPQTIPETGGWGKRRPPGHGGGGGVEMVGRPLSPSSS